LDTAKPKAATNKIAEMQIRKKVAIVFITR
jgi:hypothetical protein